MEFTYPQALWLILLILPLYIFTRNSVSGLPKWRFVISFALRIIIFLLIIGALSEVHLIKPNDKLCVIFALDVSRSIGDEHREEAIDFIKKSMAKKDKKDEGGLIVFGGNSSVEFVPSSNPEISYKINSLVDSNHTDIAGALRLALAMFPADCNKRIVLLSDGRENMENALNEALLISSNSIPVDVAIIANEKKREVFISEFNVPDKINLDEPFETKIIVESTLKGKGKLQFYRDNKMTLEKDVFLEKGKNIFVVPQKVKESGFYGYEVKIIPTQGGDTILDNNAAYGYTKASGKPKILLITDSIAKSFPLTRALNREKLKVDCFLPDNFPSRLSELQNYDCLIMSDIEAARLSAVQMKQIEAYVRDLAGGFIMIGGQNSFGVGGYFDTPIEETLPVSMDIRKNRHLPSMALILLIDKSGSMAERGTDGTEKIALAREAAIACVSLLSPTDQIGILGFDDAAKWVIPFQMRSDDKSSIIRDIASLRAGGGTNAYPALLEGKRVLNSTEAILKHVIILSDGRTEGGDFDNLVKEMKGNGITVSCVGIGEDADIPFLQSMAKSGGGRFYYTKDVSLLPMIFTKEAMIASRAAIVEKEFLPVINKYTGAIRGIDWKGVPPLGGYVLTTPKDRAEMLLLTPDNDPLLARWNYGIGRAIAFTSDAKTRWASKWIGWKSFSSFWAQLVRWTMRHDENPLLDLSVSFEGGEGHIIVDAVDEDGEFMNLLDLKGRVIDPQFKSYEINLKQQGPGRYEALFPSDEIGSYFISVGSDKTGYQSSGVSQSTPPEYKTFKPDRFLMAGIARETGGRILSLNDYGKVFCTPQKKFYQVKEIWPLLIMIAILLFPLDVAIRRIFLPDKWFEYIAARFNIPKTLVKDDTTYLSRLKEKKIEAVKEKEQKIPIAIEKNKLKFIISESNKKADVNIIKKDREQNSSIARLKGAKKKARDDMK